jgi:hypothetical protein
MEGQRQSHATYQHNCLGKIDRGRVTQIMNLLNFAPDIQEEILFLSPVVGGRAQVTERELRSVWAIVDWERQRETRADLGQRIGEPAS